MKIVNVNKVLTITSKEVRPAPYLSLYVVIIIRFSENYFVTHRVNSRDTEDLTVKAAEEWMVSFFDFETVQINGLAEKE